MNFGTYEEELAIKNFIVSLLVRQAQSDENFTPVEKKYLAFAGRALGLSSEEVATIRLNPGAYVISPPPDEQRRMTILYYLLFMMWADGHVEPKEEEFCHHVGFQLGFRRDMISDLVGVMKQFLKEEIPPNAMLERIKPYLN